MLGTVFELVTTLAVVALLAERRARARARSERLLWTLCLVGVGGVTLVLVAALMIGAVGVVR